MGVVDPTVIVALIGAVAGIVTTALTLWQRKRVSEVHDQVTNTHGTNLREDVDELLHGLRRVRDDIADLRKDARQERAERIELSRRVDDALRGHHRSE